MNRRTYLAVLCAPLAGCAGSEDGSTDTPTTTPTEGSTPTDASTPTSTATEEPTDTATDTETETATPSDEEIAADHLDAAEGHLQAAVAAFSDPADGDGLLAVDGSVAPAEAAVTEELDAVTAELDDAAEYATGDQQATIEDLRHLRAFLAELVAVQADAHALWTATRDGIDAVVGETFDDPKGLKADLVATAEDLAAGVDALGEMANPDATAASEAITETGYSEKRDQLAAERATGSQLAEVLRAAAEGMVDFAEGTDYYVAGNISSAEAPYWGSYNDLEDAVGAMPDEHADAYGPLIEDLDCFLGAMEVAADKMERSARLGREKVSEDATQQALEGCDLVADSPSASELLEWLKNR